MKSNIYAYESIAQALSSIIRQGPSELFRGFFASSLRDAPYAGLFVVFYEGIKREACATLFLHVIVVGGTVIDPIIIQLWLHLRQQAASPLSYTAGLPR